MMLLYNLLIKLAMFFGFPVIGLILIFSQKRRKTFFKRLGLRRILPNHIDPETDRAQPIWIHALSVGEVLSAEPLVRALKKRFPDAPLLFSVSTLTGHQVAQCRFQSSVAAVFYFPYDLIFAVKRTAAAADPILVIIVETDIWPNFLCEMKRRGVPVLFVNARMSDASFKGYRRLRFFMAPVFGDFSHVCAQTDQDAQRFLQLGIASDRITVTGNIKFDQDIADPDSDAVEGFRKRLAIDSERRVFLAGSTHEGEETILKSVFLRLRQYFSDLLLIIVPRNPDRAPSIRRIFQSDPLTVCLMNAPEGGRRCDVFLVDAIGVLKHLYALSDVAFVGGSLVKAGGHNPLEPAAYSKPILFGSDMSDFKEISRMLLKEEAAFQVHGAESLFDAARSLLDDPSKADAMGRRAFRLFSQNNGATERTVRVVESYFHQAEIA